MVTAPDVRKPANDGCDPDTFQRCEHIAATEARRVALRWRLDEGDAKQEALLALVKSLRRSAGEDAPLRMWRARRDIRQALGAWAHRETGWKAHETATDPHVMAETLDGEDARTESPEAETLDAETLAQLGVALTDLPPKAADVIRARLGLLTGQPMTFDQIAVQLGYRSRSGAFLACKRASARLARAMSLRKL